VRSLLPFLRGIRLEIELDVDEEAAIGRFFQLKSASRWVYGLDRSRVVWKRFVQDEGDLFEPGGESRSTWNGTDVDGPAGGGIWLVLWVFELERREFVGFRADYEGSGDLFGLFWPLLGVKCTGGLLAYLDAAVCFVGRHFERLSGIPAPCYSR
jgi:hypothetical protein